MTIPELIAWVGRWMYFHQDDPEAQAALDAIRKSLRRLEQYDAEALAPQVKKFEKYQEFVTCYFEFHQATAGVSPRMNAAQGKAMNEIIAYLVKESATKDETGALLAWQYVLKNWTHLTPFLKNQVALIQINKNLIEILSQYRNGRDKRTEKARTSADLKRRYGAGRDADGGHGGAD